MKKRIFKKMGVPLLVGVFFLLCFSIIVVKAVDELTSDPSTGGAVTEESVLAETGDNTNITENANATCEYLKDENIISFIKRYGADISYNNKTNHFVVKLVKENAEESIQRTAAAVKFKVTKVTLKIMEETEVVSTIEDPDAIVSNYLNGGTNSLTFDHELNIKNTAVGKYARYEIILYSDGFFDELVDEKCGPNSKFYLKLTYEYGGGEIVQSDPEAVKYEYPDVTANVFSCENYTSWDPESFNYKYCDDLQAAKNKGILTFDFTTKKTYSEKFEGKKEAETFKCNAWNSLNSTIANQLSSNSTYQYINKSYRLGRSVISQAVGEYVYNYGGQNSKGVGAIIKKVPVSCEVSCLEVVTVEYGVPIATTAGLCFEYDIKLTSRVNCDLTTAPDPPEQKDDFCTPTPECIHKWAGANPYVAGPSEDFDSCVNECDGGKYSDKCVDQCYQDVYEMDPLAAASGMSNYSDPSLAKKIVLTFDENYVYKRFGHNTIERDELHDGEGTYRWNSKMTNIIWTPENRYGRFYLYHPHSIAYHACTKTVEEGGGISSECDCSAVCQWTGCEGEVYLNPGEYSNDNTYNHAEYERVLDLCKGMESCNTSVTTFSMDVTLKNYEVSGNDAVVHFPFDQNKTVGDRIFYSKESGNIGCMNNTQYKYGNSTIISTDGCNKCNTSLASITDQNLYSAEFGFAGTWIGTKSGEISFSPPSTKDWFKYKRKFCTPLDMNETNADWWLYYYSTKYGRDGSYAFNDEAYLRDVKTCKDGVNLSGLATRTIPEKSDIEIDYNIVGKARDFGLFQWNIDVSCFYAYARLDKTCGEQLEKVRSVDLNNLFPNPDGTPLTSPSESGRSPGFNWSYHATNITKDTSYTSSPIEYMKWVQEKGYSVYSDSYLDYEILLTRSDIRALQNSTTNYTSYTGDYTVDSVVNYRSPLLRGAEARFTNSNGSKIPNEEALKCNNMRNYDSTECENISEE